MEIIYWKHGVGNRSYPSGGNRITSGYTSVNFNRFFTPTAQIVVSNFWTLKLKWDVHVPTPPCKLLQPRLSSKQFKLINVVEVFLNLITDSSTHPCIWLWRSIPLISNLQGCFIWFLGYYNNRRCWSLRLWPPRFIASSSRNIWSMTPAFSSKLPC